MTEGNQKWLSIKQFKEKLVTYYQDKPIYSIVKDRKGVIQPDEKAFFTVELPPKVFKNNVRGKIYPNYVMKVTLTSYDHETKQWILDDEMINLKLGIADYNFLNTHLKPSVGMRIGVTGNYYQSKMGYQILGRKWSISAKAEEQNKPNIQSNSPPVSPKPENSSGSFEEEII